MMHIKLLHHHLIILIEVIHHEILLIFDFILKFLLNGMLYLIFLDFMKFHWVFDHFAYEGAPVQDLGVHIAKEEFHLIKFSVHLAQAVGETEHFGVFFDQRVASLGRTLHQKFMFILTLKFVDLIVFIVDLKHLITATPILVLSAATNLFFGNLRRNLLLRILLGKLFLFF